MSAPTQTLPAIAQDAEQNHKLDLFSSAGFSLALRVARALSTADCLPDPFRAFFSKRQQGEGGAWEDVVVENPSALGNLLVATEVARSIGSSIVNVAMNADVIQGKLRWSSKFQIGAINASGRFSPLQFAFERKGKMTVPYREKTSWNRQKRGYDFVEKSIEIDEVECRAWAYMRDPLTGKLTATKIEGPAASVSMAVQEGWYTKEGSKWSGAMQELMLHYRAGTFFGSIHAPDVIMGMGQPPEFDPSLVVEAEVREVAALRPAAASAPAERVDDEPPRKAAAPTEPTPAPQAANVAERALEQTVDAVVAATAATPAPTPAPAPPSQASAAAADQAAGIGEKQNLRIRAQEAGVTMAALLDKAGITGVDAETLDRLTKDQWRAAKAQLTG